MRPGRTQPKIGTRTSNQEPKSEARGSPLSGLAKGMGQKRPAFRPNGTRQIDGFSPIGQAITGQDEKPEPFVRPYEPGQTSVHSRLLCFLRLRNGFLRWRTQTKRGGYSFWWNIFPSECWHTRKYTKRNGAKEDACSTVDEIGADWWSYICRFAVYTTDYNRSSTNSGICMGQRFINRIVSNAVGGCQKRSPTTESIQRNCSPASQSSSVFGAATCRCWLFRLHVMN